MMHALTFVATALWLVASLAHAMTLAPHIATVLAEAQKAVQPVAVHFHATWYSTCKAQDKAFMALQADPSLKLTVLQVDYDTEGDLKKQLKVRTQSTLIVHRGAEQRARLSGET